MQSQREAVHASGADTLAGYFLGGRGARSRLTCSRRSLLRPEPRLGKSQTFPRPPWLQRGPRERSCKEALNPAGAAKGLPFGLIPVADADRVAQSVGS